LASCAAAHKARFYDYARASAEECAAILDAASIRGLASLERGLAGRALLHRAVRLLSGLIRSALRRSAAPRRATALLAGVAEARERQVEALRAEADEAR